MAPCPCSTGAFAGERAWVMLHRDIDITAKLLDEEHPGDGAAWRALLINGGGSVRVWWMRWSRRSRHSGQVCGP